VRRRVGLAIAALAVWVAGTVVGSLGPSTQRAVAAGDRVVIGRAHAEFAPQLGGDDPIFILALGSDSRPETPIERGLSDSIHIIAINPKKHRVSILGFPRDSYVPIPGHGSGKINSAMATGGPPLTVQTVEALTGIRFDYYVLTSFEGVQDAVNDIGGLTIDVPFPMFDSYSRSNFAAGVQTLNGHDTLAFARDRHSLESGDFGRSENQGRVLLAALTQLRKQYAKDPSVLFDYIGAGMRNVQTDLTTPEVLDFAFMALSINPTHVDNMVAPGTIGTVGTMSTVNLLSSNSVIYKDLADDGLVSERNQPRSPTANQT